MAKLNVLVSGSGIAGSVFAFWLLRGHPDANITIIERDPALRLTGASVDIRSSGVDIIKLMGLEQAIRDQTTKEEGVQFVDAHGENVATFKATGRTDVQSITSEFEIFRGALAQIFITPILKRVNLVFNETVESYEQREDGVAVKFSKSREVKTYDLLVAADGFRSKIRGAMLQTKPEEQIQDDSVHAAYFTIKKDLLGGRLAKWYNSTLGRAIFLRPDPAGYTRATIITITGSGDERKKKLNNSLRNNENFMNLLDDMFYDAGWLAPEVLKAMRESDDFYCSLFAQIRSPKLEDGRVVLLGDAGYATPGIGTSLAIMGGYIMAGELLNHPVEEASKRYEKLMLPFVKGQQFGGSGFGMLNPQTWWGLRVRNFVLWLVAWMMLDRFVMYIGWLLGYAEKKIDLPDYRWPKN